MDNHKKELVNSSLNVLAEMLPEGQFYQCHRSYIVALEAIRSVRKYEIFLKNGEMVPVSRSRYQGLQEALLNWNFHS